MALKTIMLRKSIDKKKAELEAAIGEAETDEEQAAVSEQVEAYDTEHNAHEAAKDGLTREIETLENELAEEERKQTVPAPAAGKTPEERREKIPM